MSCHENKAIIVINIAIIIFDNNSNIILSVPQRYCSSGIAVIKIIQKVNTQSAQH